MKKFLVLPLLFLCLVTFAQKSTPLPKRFAGLDTAFARVLKDWKAAGFAVAVVEKNKIIWSQGFGYKDVAGKQPVDANTVFAIGSCTKAFTSSVIGLLNKDGLLEYDKPVKTYLPAMNFYNDEMNTQVTVRDLMCHRTGVSRYDYSWYFFPTDSRDTLMKRMQFMEPSAPLRQKFQYNNFMFMLQGAVAEKLTGKTWEQNVRDRILQPLGMTNTTLGFTDWAKSTDRAFGYNLTGDTAIHKQPFFNIRAMAPAGSINSSVNDMAKWVQVWINGGRFEGKEILPATYVSEAMSSQMVVTGALPGGRTPDVFMSTYGFGWFLASYRGHYRVEHGGNIDGFSASTSFFPSDSIGIIVLVNQDGSAVPSIIRNIVADRVLGLKYRDWQTELYSAKVEGDKKAKEAAKTATSTRKRGTSPSHPITEYTGVYTSPGNETFEIALRGDSLYMQLPGDRSWWVRNYHYDVFNLLDLDDIAANDTSDTQGVKLSFASDDNGNIASASMPLEGNRPIVFSKTAKAIPMPKDSLVKYTGDYNLQGSIVKVYIKGENTLYVFLTGQPEYELIPTEKDKFKIRILNGFSVNFATNEKGEVLDLTFVQPNGTFKATKVIEIKKL